MDKKTFENALKSLFSLKGIGVLLALSGIMGYALTGFDLIPDKIPILGYVDDVLLIIIGYLGISRLIHRITKNK